MAPSSTARWLAIAGTIDGVIFVVGGYGSTALNLNEAYDPTTDSWTAIPSIHGGGAGAVAGDRFYIIGGLYADAQAVHIYNPSVDH